MFQWYSGDGTDGVSPAFRCSIGTQPNSEDALGANLRGFELKRDKLTVDQEGVLVFENLPNKFVPVVPSSALESLATELHVVLTHAGRDKTISVMYNRLYHPEFPRVISDVVRACQACQNHKGCTSSKHPVYRRQVEKPYQMYAVDLMDLPKSKRGFKTVLSGIDMHSKFAHVVPLRSKRAETVARALELHVLATIPRTPDAVMSDNGPEFRSSKFNELLQRYGIRHEYSVPYAPNTNGAIERFNRTLKSRLATACDGNTRHWDRKLSHIVAQYNRTPHAETGKAPTDFFVPDSDIIIPIKSRTWRASRKFRSFAVGDLVLRRTPYQAPGERDKLAPKFQGPLRIISVDPGGVTYQAKWLTGRKKTIQVHQSQVKRYYGESPPAIARDSMRSTSSGNPTNKRPTMQELPFGLDVALLNRIPYVPEVMSVPASPAEPSAQPSYQGETSGDEASFRSILEEPIPFNIDESSGDSVDEDGVISDHCIANRSNMYQPQGDEPPDENDEGVISDGCRPNSPPGTPTTFNSGGSSPSFLGGNSREVQNAPVVVTSTPVRRNPVQSCRNIVREISSFHSEDAENSAGVSGVNNPDMPRGNQLQPPHADQNPSQISSVMRDGGEIEDMEVGFGDVEMGLDYDGTYFFDDPDACTDSPVKVSLDLEQMRAYYEIGYFTELPEPLPPLDSSNSSIAGCLPCKKCCII